MIPDHSVSRRTFLAATGGAGLALGAPASAIPVGLELYSVRDELAKNQTMTLREVARDGYQVVEFYAPYYSWTTDEAKQVRKLMDSLGIRCNSTHNGGDSLAPEGIGKAIELNQILGAKYIVWASAGRPAGLHGWKAVAEKLSAAAAKLKPLGMGTGYHNHQLEFTPIEGKRPIEVIAANTPAEVMLQLDVGTCVEAGSDPVAWIQANPGRIRSIHCKDWAPGEGKGYRVLFGEGVAPWPAIFQAAENGGGVEYYLIEQEGSRFPELEGVERCLANWKRIKA
ncbi:MAG: sugar phosphate isomerase/epimerase [Bryobacteraceae bacterium]|jgi:sugar phosphate isomerase/epimerase